MKKIKQSLCAIIILAIAFVQMAACDKAGADDLWANAIYTSDTVIGEGETSVEVEVKAGDKSVTLTVNTDKTILGDALLEYGIVEGDMGQFGLYVKKVNGILADYDVDCTYWAIYKSGEYMMTGVDGIEISSGEHYELVRTK